jgi:hypothetical protein
MIKQNRQNRAHRRRIGKKSKFRVAGQVTAATVSLALVVTGTSGIIANAAPSQSPRGVSGSWNAVVNQPQQAPANTDQLDVAVGTTVAATTDQKGNVSPFNLFIVNGQVSGVGSGVVAVPVGPDKDSTFEFDNEAGQVQNITQFEGLFAGEIPVELSTEVTVNGEEIDPDEAYDLTGDVVIKYKFLNKTNRKQDITFTDLYGKTTTKKAKIPVPFGATFKVPFGDGWFINESKGMQQSSIPTGVELNATVMNFPIIPGSVGSTEEVLKVKARAEGARLPSTLASYVAVDLSTFANGLALNLIPGVESKALGPINSILDGAVGQVYAIANEIGGFAGALETLNTQALDPILNDISTVNIDPNALTANLESLATGITDLGGLMEANAEAQKRFSTLFIELAAALDVAGSEVIPMLGRALKALGPDATEAAKGLRILNKVLRKLNANKLTRDVNTLAPTCDVVGNTSKFYGYPPLDLKIALPFVPPLILWPGNQGHNALDNVIEDNTPRLGTPPEWVKELETLQGQLDSQSTGTLLPSLFFGVVPDRVKNPELNELLTTPACQTVIGLAKDLVIPIAEAWKPVEIAELALALDFIAGVVESPGAAKFFNQISEGLEGAGKLLSNSACSPEDILNAINSGSGIAGIFQNCGIAQLLQFFAVADELVGVGMVDLGELVSKLEADVPAIDKTVQGISSASSSLQTTLDSLPTEVADAAGKIANVGTEVSDKGESALAKVSTGAEELDAMLVAMTERTLNGDGTPYGGATGPDTRTLTAYQLTQTEAAATASKWWTSLGLAVIFLVVGLGIGTWQYRRRLG